MCIAISRKSRDYPLAVYLTEMDGKEVWHRDKVHMQNLVLWHDEEEALRQLKFYFFRDRIPEQWNEFVLIDVQASCIIARLKWDPAAEAAER